MWGEGSQNGVHKGKMWIFVPKSFFFDFEKNNKKMCFFQNFWQIIFWKTVPEAWYRQIWQNLRVIHIYHLLPHYSNSKQIGKLVENISSVVIRNQTQNGAWVLSIIFEIYCRANNSGRFIRLQQTAPPAKTLIEMLKNYW